MIEIGIAYPTDPLYEDISKFARGVYLKRLNSKTAASPDVFAYATCQHSMIGCLGLNKSNTHTELFFEMCRPSNAYERLAGIPYPDRTMLGELGTRAVAFSEITHQKSTVISLALSATILSTAHTLGIRYIGFVTNRTIYKVAKALQLTLVELGEPDYSKKDNAFRENLSGFLDVRQICIGLVLNDISGCEKVLNDLERDGVIAQLHRPLKAIVS